MDYYLIQAHGSVAEEFVRRNDFSTAGLRSSDAALSRLIRTDPTLSVVPLAGEQTGAPIPLRDYDEFPSAPMLALSPSQPLPGFREKRLYRVLFARTPAEPSPAGGEYDEGGDSYSWLLRHVAGGVAWCLDVTAHLNEGASLGPVLEHLTGYVRLRHKLIPVTTERFQ